MIRPTPRDLAEEVRRRLGEQAREFCALLVAIEDVASGLDPAERVAVEREFVGVQQRAHVRLRA